MLERFKDKVMQYAEDEARRFNHDHVGTEHILLGLLKDEGGVAAKVLRKLGVDWRRARLEIEKRVTSGPGPVPFGRLPLTPRARKVIEYAIEEARNLNHDAVGTEHLLLGLLHEPEGLACQALVNLGLNREDVRREALCPREEEAPDKEITSTPAVERRPSDDLYAGFSGQARKAVHLAYQEAQHLRNDYVGTEHLLVGILQEGSPGVARLLEARGQSAEELRRKVEVLLPPGEAEVGWEPLPLSPDARRSLDAARQEAARLQHSSVTPEHLFLALLQQTESTAAHVLSHLGLTLDTLRSALEKLPATENRDWMMGAAPGTYGVRDPSPRDLAAVVTPDVLPPEKPYPAEEVEPDEEGGPADSPPSFAANSLRRAKRRQPSDADLDLPVVLQQLHLLQLVLVTVVAMILGGLALGVAGAGLGFFVGSLFALVIMNTRYVGALVGMTAGMSWVMLTEHRNWGLFIVGALGGLVVGGCLGDWREFRAPPGSGGGPGDA